ncbi:MAG: EF-hand domain-containing protein [Paracoccaceae bacterium]
MRFIWICLTIWLTLPGLAFSQAVEIHAKLDDALSKRPEYFVQEVASVILGHGTDGRIDAAGIDRFIALERARSRAYYMRRFHQADLDADGTISRAEMQVLQDVSSARQRGLLEVEFRKADANNDGRVTPDELADFAENGARRGFSTSEALAWRSLIALDRDGDGAVSLDDVMAAVAARKGEPA